MLSFVGVVHVSERDEITRRKYGAIVSAESNCGTKPRNILILFLEVTTKHVLRILGIIVI